PGGFTMEAWIYPMLGLPSGDYGGIFKKTDRYNRVHMLHFQVNAAQERLYAAMNQQKPDGGFEWIGAGNTIGSNEWHHVAWTYDEQYHRFYLDGVEIHNVPFTDPWVGNDVDLEIGQFTQLPAHASFFGMIDEPRIYRGALTRDEIIRDMNSSGIIPEPSTFFLLGTGLLGLVFVRRKR
ncbi:LamG domain-containing protein, partial [Omnitrophica bacterium]|nr:LamG domain-containing protein [Candidatus Omnitrophota bacterium]